MSLKLLWAVLALAVSIGLAACGGDDSSSSANGAASAESAPSREALDCDRELTVEEIIDYPVPKADERYDVTLMLVSLAGYYYQGQAYGAEQAAKAAGVDLSIVASDGFATAPQQITQAENVLTRGTDAIVLSPADVNGSVPIVEQATAQDVPVVVAGTNVNSPDAIKILQDDYLQGRAAADALAAELPDGGQGIVMGGPANATWSTSRVNGFKDRLAEAHPKLEISTVANSLVDPGEGLAKFANAASANPTVDWIYAAYNLLLPPDSIPAAYEDAVYVAGALDPLTRTALENGSARAVVPDWPIYMGYVGVAEAVEALNGDVPPDLTCMPNPVITTDDLESEVAEAQLFPEGYEASN